MAQPHANNPLPSFSTGHVDDVTRHRLKQLVAPHVDSFDHFLEYGLDEAIADLQPVLIEIDETYSIKLEVISAMVGYPTRYNQGMEVPITPREARESHITYSGKATCNLRVTLEGTVSNTFVLPVSLGELPLMVMSQRCHLRSLKPQKLVELKEEGKLSVANSHNRSNES